MKFPLDQSMTFFPFTQRLGGYRKGEPDAFYTRGKQHGTMLECTSCSGRLCDHALHSRGRPLKRVTIHKAARSDGLPGCVIRECADQLASVFTNIFNLSLTQSVIPTCFKQTTIVPVSKNAKVTCLNDYHPIALTSVAMKCFGRMVLAHINNIISDTLDPLQVAYRLNRSTGDAVSIALHTALSHLVRRNTYVRMPFIDYSSVFNTIVPWKLITTLRSLGLNISFFN